MRIPKRPVTDDPVMLRIIEQLEEQGKTEKGLIEFLGLTSNMFTVWKYGDSKSYMKRIDKIAEYLGLTKEYLLNGRDSGSIENILTGTEIRILTMYRSMRSEEQEIFIKVGRSLTDASKYHKTEEQQED